MVLAKYKRFPDIKSTGSFGVKPLVAFTSSDSHYSIQKAVHWLGIGTDNLIMVDTDQNGCISVDNLIKNIDDVIRSNRQPFFVNATAGTTVLGAFDNLNAIAEVCEKYNLWMHVDVSQCFPQILIEIKILILIPLKVLSWRKCHIFRKIQISIEWC